MSRARTFADLATASEGNNISIPNMIINGDCRVAQRGTSTASITTGTNFVVDRWKFQPSGHGTWTLSQNSSTGLAGFETSVKALCTSNGGTPAGADFVFFIYNIEGYDTQRLKFGQSDAERFTLSWYVKSNKTGTGIVEAQTTHSSGTVETTKTYTISQANTWEFKSVTFPANTDFEQVAANKTTSSGLGLRWIIDSGTNLTSGTAPTTWANQTASNRWAGHSLNIGRADDDYMEITGVQLDIGDVAQPFKHESFADNLQRCQRYFYKFLSTNVYGPLGATGMQINTNASSGTMFQGMHPVMMRTAPSLAIGGSWLGEVATGGITFSLAESVRVSNLFWQVQEAIPTSGANNGDAAMVYAGNDNDAFFSGDAEL